MKYKFPAGRTQSQARSHARPVSSSGPERAASSTRTLRRDPSEFIARLISVQITRLMAAVGMVYCRVYRDRPPRRLSAKAPGPADRPSPASSPHRDVRSPPLCIRVYIHIYMDTIYVSIYLYLYMYIRNGLKPTSPRSPPVRPVDCCTLETTCTLDLSYLSSTSIPPLAVVNKKLPSRDPRSADTP